MRFGVPSGIVFQMPSMSASNGEPLGTVASVSVRVSDSWKAVTSDTRGYRLTSIDFVRGLAVVVMALDHVRDFTMHAAAQDPLQNFAAGPGLFLTRWITHFCAPIFVLLAGTSAGLMLARKSPARLRSFLTLRGLWLVFVEMAVISTALTFAPLGIAEVNGRILIFMQVIWVIGASMIVLAVLQPLGRSGCLIIGAAILCAHNLLDTVWPSTSLFGPPAPLWTALHSQMSASIGPLHLGFLYPLLPWIGVMLLGFGISGVFQLEPRVRDRLLLKWGVGATIGFVVLRALDLYGDPKPWHGGSAGMWAAVGRFLNTTKYPPSLLFLLMTLGPAAILCSFADRMRGSWKDVLVTIGRVPFAFYVVHFYLIHALSLLVGVAQGFQARQFLTVCLFYPQGYGLPLSGVYLLWALVIALLYPFCRWLAGVKARRRDWWLSYL